MLLGRTPHLPLEACSTTQTLEAPAVSMQEVLGFCFASQTIPMALSERTVNIMVVYLQ